MSDEQETTCAGGTSHDPGNPTWCPGCATGIGTRLAGLPVLVWALDEEIATQNGGADDAPITGSRGRHSPSPAVDDIDEITRLLEYWEDAHRELRGLPRRPFRPYGRRVGTAAWWLQRHLPGLLAAPYAEEFGRDIGRLHAMAQRRTRTHEARSRKPVPCPGCDLLTLTHTDGDRYVHCVAANCGRLITLDEYDTWARLLAADQVHGPVTEALVAALARPGLTIAQAATVTGRSRRTVTRWITEERLVPVHVGGRTMLDTRDVLTIERNTRRAIHAPRPGRPGARVVVS